jgi:hypothetical protein
MGHINISEPNNIIINQKKLYYILKKYPNIKTTFFDSRNKQLNIQITIPINNNSSIVGKYFVFSTGSINITIPKSLNNVKICIDYIQNLFNKHINDFIIKDNVWKGIHLKYKKYYKQLSKEWVSIRKTCITGSEAQCVLLNTPFFNKTKESYIYEKVYNIKNKKTKYKHTNQDKKYMFSGIMFEPIARELYIRITNSKISNNFKTQAFELGFCQKNKYIGASPDGLIFKYKKLNSSKKMKSLFEKKTEKLDIHYLIYKNINIFEILQKAYNLDYLTKFTYDEYIYLYKKKILVDCHLIEIKCPYKKNTSLSDVPFNLKKYRKDYYCQVQTQLYSTELPYCIFMICYLSIISRNIAIKQKAREKYTGVLVKILDHDESDDYTPTFIYPIDFVDSIYNNEKELKLKIKKRNIKKYQFIYWIMDDYKLIDVDYDKDWFNKKYPRIIEAYNEIKEKSESNKILYDPDDPDDENDYII